MPLRLRIGKREEDWEEEEEIGKIAREAKDNTKVKEIVLWTADVIEKFKEKTEVVEQIGNQEGWTVEERWQWMKKIAKEAMVRKRIKVKKRKIRFKDWWDRDCTKKKRGLQRCYKSWRRGKVGLEIYTREKKLKEFLEEKQRRRREKEEEELKNLRKETEV